MKGRIIFWLFLLLGWGISRAIAQESVSITTTALFTISQSGYEKAENRLITTQAEWDEFCHKIMINTPPIDFSQEMVLVITGGKFPSTGYEIKVTEVSQIDKKLAVKYIIAPPIEGEPISKTTTTPLLALKLKQTNLPIEFLRSEKEVDELIKLLGAESWQVRESATLKLIEWGKITVPSLLVALRDKDPEVVIRAHFILKEIVQNLLIERTGWIGIQMRELPTSDEKVSSFINEGVGLEIVAVVPNTPAEKFGLQREDIIIGFNGEKLESLEAFRLTIRQTLPHTRVNLTIIRQGKKIELPLVMGVRSQEHRDADLKEALWEEWAGKYLPKSDD